MILFSLAIFWFLCLAIFISLLYLFKCLFFLLSSSYNLNESFLKSFTILSYCVLRLWFFCPFLIVFIILKLEFESLIAVISFCISELYKLIFFIYWWKCEIYKIIWIFCFKSECKMIKIKRFVLICKNCIYPIQVTF